MSNTSTLKQQIERLPTWINEDALPYWASAGINPKTGAVYEQLLFNGQPDINVNQRTRVQARQIVVFSIAQQQGWLTNSLPLANNIVAFMKTHGKISPSIAGYAQCLTPDNKILEPKLDTYDFAFYLLACFHRFNAYQDTSALDEANQLLAYIECHFKNSSAGWLEGNYFSPIRRQNPHMHLFEAFMTGYEVTHDSKWLAKAGQVFSLFEQVFFDPKSGILREFFELDWQLAKNYLGKTVEPGHMFEWVWLLRWYERLTATPTGHYCDALYQNAIAIGFDPLSQLIYDAVDKQGKVINGTKRCWPLTELIKASLAQASLQHDSQRKYYEEKASLGIQLLFDYYLHPKIKGSYIDKVDEDNQVLSDHAPASTLYHFVLAATEASKYHHQFLLK